MSETTKNWWFSGSMLIYQRVKQKTAKNCSCFHQRTTHDYTHLQLLRGKSDQHNASTVFGNIGAFFHLCQMKACHCKSKHRARCWHHWPVKQDLWNTYVPPVLSLIHVVSCQVGKCTRQAFSALPAENLHDFANPQTIAYLDKANIQHLCWCQMDPATQWPNSCVPLYIYTRATWWESRKAGLDNFAYSIFLKIAIAVYLGVYRCKLRHTLVSLALTWLLARLGVLLGPNGPNLHCVAEWRFPWSKETNSLGSEVPKFLSSGRGIKWMIKSKQRYLNIFTSYPNLRLYPIYPLRLNLLACQRVELSVIGEVCVN